MDFAAPGLMRNVRASSGNSKRGGSLFRIKEGTLYPILYRLEKAGYIESRWETLERGVPRKYYRLTAAGRKYMQARLDEWREFTAAIDRLLEERQ